MQFFRGAPTGARKELLEDITLAGSRIDAQLTAGTGCQIFFLHCLSFLLVAQIIVFICTRPATCLLCLSHIATKIQDQYKWDSLQLKTGCVKTSVPGNTSTNEVFRVA